MNAAERRRLLHEVELAGSCSHPIRLAGEMVDLETGEVSNRFLRVACKDRRQVICPACSYLYKADAWVLVALGLMGGKGIPEDVGRHPRLFVTLTAPSFGPVHTIKSQGQCVTAPHWVRDERGAGIDGVERCAHGRERVCHVRHDPDDPRLGSPLCEGCFDYPGAVIWNAHASRLWEATYVTLRRKLASAAGIPQRGLSEVARLNYLKVAEMQRRGLAHLHAVIRADGPEHSESEPPAWLDAALLASTLRSTVASVRVRALDESVVRWGREWRISDLSAGDESALKAAGYVAKYATKTTDGTLELARRFTSRRQILQLVDHPHSRRLALTAWDLARRADLEALHLRHHAHAFGFTGQLITKSRGYSLTFATLRAARAAYMAGRNDHLALAGTFHYDGRGYDHPRAADLAEVLFAMQCELRQEAAQARREALHVPSRAVGGVPTCSSGARRSFPIRQRSSGI